MTNALVPVQHHERLLSCETIGKEGIKQFITKRLSSDSEVSIWTSMKLIRTPTFSASNKKMNVVVEDKVVEIQEHAALFSRFAVVASSNREFNMKDDIGRHELSVVPRSLMTADGSLLAGHEDKSNLMNAFAIDLPTVLDIEPFVEKTFIIDAMVVVQSIGGKNNDIKNCEDLANFFIEKCVTAADGYNNIRIAFDRYLESSLKYETRQHRKCGNASSIQYKIDDYTELSCTLKVFLSSENTKRNLVTYLAHKLEVYLKANLWNYFISIDGMTRSNTGQKWDCKLTQC